MQGRMRCPGLRIVWIQSKFPVMGEHVGVKGEKEARAHASETGHVQFGEY